MDSDTTSQENAESTAAFEQALEQLVLQSFVNDVSLEGAWDITVPVADAPDWTVTIEKTYSGESAPYQPSLLEE